jgi:hypothetical protein
VPAVNIGYDAQLQRGDVVQFDVVFLQLSCRTQSAEGELLTHDLTVRLTTMRGPAQREFLRSGRPIKSFRVAFRTACVDAGCPGRVLHDFRRTAVRNLVRAGVPERVAISASPCARIVSSLR